MLKCIRIYSISGIDIEKLKKSFATKNFRINHCYNPGLADTINDPMTINDILTKYDFNLSNDLMTIYFDYLIVLCAFAVKIFYSSLSESTGLATAALITCDPMAKPANIKDKTVADIIFHTFMSILYAKLFSQFSIT